MHIDQWFFDLAFLTDQLNLVSLNINSKYIRSNLFSVLRRVKRSLLTLLIPLASKSINHSFFGALIPANILATAYLMRFNLYRSNGTLHATVYHQK